MLQTPIAEDEILYRCLFPGMDMYKFRPDATLEITSQAFADKADRRASVDRAKMCGNNPQHTLRDPMGGVVSVVAGAVRSITNADITRNNRGGPFKVGWSMPLYRKMTHTPKYLRSRPLQMLIKKPTEGYA